jgi:hypothetical protein
MWTCWWAGCLSLFAATVVLGAPGDIDETFPKVQVHRASSLIQDTDGTLWVGGFLELCHLSAEGVELHRFSHSGDWSRLTPHPQGGVALAITGSELHTETTVVKSTSGSFWIQADGKIAKAFQTPEDLTQQIHYRRYFQAADKVWLFYDRSKLIALDEKGAALPGFESSWRSVESVMQGKDGTIVVLGSRPKPRRTVLATFQKDGRLASEIVMASVEPTAGFLMLEDGRFLIANRRGLFRFHGNGDPDLTYQSPFSAFGEPAHFAKRPDGRIMMICEDCTFGELMLDEDDDYIILARLTKEGDLDPSYPASPIEGSARGLAASDAWTYLLGPVGRVRVVLRREAGDLEVPLETVDVIPQSHIVVQGATLTLRPEFSQHPSMAFQWWHNGARIDGADQLALPLRAIDDNDGGVYEIEIVSPDGPTKHHAARVQVTPPLARFTGFLTKFPAQEESAIQGGHWER